jgi:hypothetical protein
MLFKSFMNFRNLLNANSIEKILPCNSFGVENMRNSTPYLIKLTSNIMCHAIMLTNQMVQENTRIGILSM